MKPFKVLPPNAEEIGMRCSSCRTNKPTGGVYEGYFLCTECVGDSPPELVLCYVRFIDAVANRVSTRPTQSRR